MSCEERRRLLAEYETATELLVAARDRLLHEVEVSPQEEYLQTKWSTDQARLAFEKARLALEKHTASHGC